MVGLDARFGGKTRGESGRGRVGSDGTCAGGLCIGTGAASALPNGQSWTKDNGGGMRLGCSVISGKTVSHRYHEQVVHHLLVRIWIDARH